MAASVRSILALSLATASLAFSACGGDDSNADEERLVEERIAREREEAEKLGRQSEKIRELEERLEDSGSAESPDGGSAADAPSPADDWPDGTAAWTVILKSTTSQSEAQAAAAGAGDGAGVLYSSNYPGLRPGYWVAFIGSYSDSDDAKSAAAGYQGRYPGAYARFVDG